MYAEQVMTRRASYVSHHSTECTARLTGPGRKPWCRPASVACTVATTGAPVWSLSVFAACATSQSCAWMTSGEKSSSTPSAARTTEWLSAITQASSSSKGTKRRVLRDPHDAHSLDHGVGRRVGVVAGDDDDRVPAAHQPGRQRVDVPAEPADDPRRVLPGQHQDVHRETSSQPPRAGPSRRRASRWPNGPSTSRSRPASRSAAASRPPAIRSASSVNRARWAA